MCIVLAIEAAQRESKESWARVLRDLCARGLNRWDRQNSNLRLTAFMAVDIRSGPVRGNSADTTTPRRVRPKFREERNRARTRVSSHRPAEAIVFSKTKNYRKTAMLTRSSYRERSDTFR